MTAQNLQLLFAVQSKAIQYAVCSGCVVFHAVFTVVQRRQLAVSLEPLVRTVSGWAEPSVARQIVAYISLFALPHICAL